MSPLWGYVGSLVHWFIELMKPIHIAPLEQKHTCRPSGALGNLVVLLL